MGLPHQAQRGRQRGQVQGPTRAKGFAQIQGVDYFDTYSFVTRLASFRTILALAARQDWDVESVDFNGAYFNRQLDDDEVHMQEPPGYETAQGSASVKQLRTSLYGLKQAGCKCYDDLCRTIADLGFRASTADPGIFSLT